MKTAEEWIADKNIVDVGAAWLKELIVEVQKDAVDSVLYDIRKTILGEDDEG